MLKERLKGVVIGVIATLALVVTIPVLANSITTTIRVTYRNIGVSVDGREIITEQEPFIFEGRTFLAVRDIAEAFGAEIRMNEVTNTVEITSRQDVQGGSDIGGATPQASPAPSPTASPRATSSPSPSASPGPTSSPSSGNQSDRPASPAIGRERAIEIAEADLSARGLSGTFRSASMGWERNQWVWEVEFRSGRTVYEWYINVNTGNIVKFEID